MPLQKKRVSLRRLRKLLSYNESTGIFRCLIARGKKRIGDIAGTVNGAGYRQITIDWQRYVASRLVWFYVYGKWPSGEIDHKNGNPSDDRLSNLRDVTHSENQQNQRRAQRNSTLGIFGVYGKRNKFKTKIMVNGKVINLGVFSTPEAAHAAYVAAKRRLHSTCTI